jgi:hypothetical protein
MMVLVTMLVGVSARNAWALGVRLVHAVPGAGSAKLSAGSASTAPVSFGGVSSTVSPPSGRVTLRLVAADGGSTLASAPETLQDGNYTVVATKKGAKVTLLMFHDQAAAGGKASVRAIHAAPELGKAVVSADRRPLGKPLAFEQASPYKNVEPGAYKLDVMRPNGKGGALATKSGVNLEAGTSNTAVVAGSGGRPTTIIVASDRAVAPTKAPQTGLGGLAESTPWLAALLAALAAGLAGGAAYTVAVRRRGA